MANLRPLSRHIIKWVLLVLSKHTSNHLSLYLVTKRSICPLLIYDFMLQCIYGNGLFSRETRHIVINTAQLGAFPGSWTWSVTIFDKTLKANDVNQLVSCKNRDNLCTFTASFIGIEGSFKRHKRLKSLSAYRITCSLPKLTNVCQIDIKMKMNKNQRNVWK